MSSRRIGQIFVDMGFMTDDQLVLLLEEQQQQPGALLGKLAEDMSLITDEQLAQALGEQQNMKVVSLGDAPIAQELLDRLTETMAQLYRVIPVRFDGHRLTVATCDPQNLTIQDELRTFLGYDIEMVVATEREIKASIERFYSSESLSVEKIVRELADDTSLYQQASLLMGDVPACPNGGDAVGSPSGGVNNFPRFVERWTDVPLVINGSMVGLFRAERGNARFLNAQTEATGTIRRATSGSPYPDTTVSAGVMVNICDYRPPIRRWTFDQVLLTGIDKLPPGTPRVVANDRLRWVRR